MKKRKRFYNNKKRNQKWTEEEKGRKIDFADKYIKGGETSDKYDSKRPKSVKNSAKQKAKRQKRMKNLIIALICLAIISVGYTAMDVHMLRKESVNNPKSVTQSNDSAMRDIEMRFSSLKTDSIGLDSSVMLSSIIDNASKMGFNAITFDAKRSDGTIGYASKLASVDTYNALSSPASKPKASVKELLANDILPIARIACYKDNVAPAYLSQAAITNEKGKLYKDEDKNTYLNPNSELAYSYIKDIVSELSSMGVSVFILCDTKLPDEISESYSDGFETLANKLYSDIGTNIKLLEEIDVSIYGKDESSGEISKAAIEKEIASFETADKNKTYYISSQLDKKLITEQLEKNNIISYTLAN
jgi:hypothetical protein